MIFPVRLGLAALSVVFACTCAAQDLSSLPFQKNYVQRRATSSDPTGGNDDGNSKNPIKPGEERTIAQLSGPGIITDFWFTVADSESYHLKRIVLRMFWDDDPQPAVETPLGDFFGLGLGQYIVYQSAPLSVGSQKALNCSSQCPSANRRNITITNEGQERHFRLLLQHRLGKASEACPTTCVLLLCRVPAGAAEQGWTDD